MDDPSSFFCWFIPLILVVGLVVSAINGAKKEEEKKAQAENKLNTHKSTLHNTDFVSSKHIQLPALSIEVRIDLEHQKLAILSSLHSNVIMIMFSDILHSEIVQDNSTIMGGGIGRAIAGGIIAGGAGAIVGATTRKSKDVVSDLRIKITTTNISNPLITVKLITSQTEKSSSLYQQCIEFAEEVQATIESIISQQ